MVATLQRRQPRPLRQLASELRLAYASSVRPSTTETTPASALPYRRTLIEPASALPHARRHHGDLFVGGSESTLALLGNALTLLSDNPDALQTLRRDGTLEDVEATIEEALRFDAPVQYLARTVQASTTLHGVEIADGERLVLVWTAPNRDPERWDRPDEFDIGREQHRHLGFGEVIHFCVGAPLARLTGESRCLHSHAYWPSTRSREASQAPPPHPRMGTTRRNTDRRSMISSGPPAPASEATICRQRWPGTPVLGEERPQRPSREPLCICLG